MEDLIKIFGKQMSASLEPIETGSIYRDARSQQEGSIFVTSQVFGDRVDVCLVHRPMALDIHDPVAIISLSGEDLFDEEEIEESFDSRLDVQNYLRFSIVFFPSSGTPEDRIRRPIRPVQCFHRING